MQHTGSGVLESVQVLLVAALVATAPVPQAH